MKRNLKVITISSLSLVLFTLMTVTSAFAQSVSASGSATTSGRMLYKLRHGAMSSTTVAQIQSKSDTEIDSRISSLDNLISRVQLMVKISDSEKTTIINTLQ